MVDINLETGLPEIPEGHFWRVVDQDTHWGIYPYVSVQMILPFTITRREKKKFLWFKYEGAEITERNESIIIDQGIWDPNVEAGDDTAIVFTDLEGVRRPALHRNELTPESILAAAQKGLNTYQKRLTAKSLMGDYPPKKLTVSDEV